MSRGTLRAPAPAPASVIAVRMHPQVRGERRRADFCCTLQLTLCKVCARAGKLQLDPHAVACPLSGRWESALLCPCLANDEKARTSSSLQDCLLLSAPLRLQRLLQQQLLLPIPPPAKSTPGYAPPPCPTTQRWAAVPSQLPEVAGLGSREPARRGHAIQTPRSRVANLCA